MSENRAEYHSETVHIMLCKEAWRLYHVWHDMVTEDQHESPRAKAAWEAYRDHRRQCTECREEKK